ncbi:MAG: hypothetical protein GXP38_00855, partial [Chloroflexi bacterium]|nr:hypothetical protein [Chloroflexota bacterium]
SRLLLNLSRPGERGPAYVYGLNSNDSGVFAMPGMAAPGAYRLRLKGLHTLRNLLPAALSSGLNTVDLGTLLEGDAWGDNRINIRDVSLLARSYGTARGQSGYDVRCDFDQDGLIDQNDVALLQANLGQRGDILVGMTAASLRDGVPPLELNASLAPTATVSLSLVPGMTTAVTGDVIVLDVLADTGSTPVDAAEIHLDFDPALLQVVDAQGAPAAAIEPGPALNTVLLNRVDPARGHIDYLATALGSTPAQGQVQIARLRLRILQSEQGWVRFSFASWRSTDVSYQGASVLQNVSAASINAALTPLYLPMVMK